MICMLLLLIHGLCVAFGYDGFIKDMFVMSTTPILEFIVIDIPIGLFIGWIWSKNNA